MPDVQARAGGIREHVEDVELARKVSWASHNCCHLGSMRWNGYWRRDIEAGISGIAATVAMAE